MVTMRNSWHSRSTMLKHLKAIDDGIDEQQRLLAGAVQVVDDAGVVAPRETGAVPLALDALALLRVGRQPDRGFVALVCGLELADQAVQVALQLERLRAGGFEHGIALGDLARSLRKLQRGRVSVALLRLVRRAQEVRGRLGPDGAVLEMVRQRLDDLVEAIGVARLERLGDAGMQGATAVVHEAVIGDASGEPVPEGIRDVREQTRLVQKFARPQVGERAMQLFRRIGDGFEERERHVLANHRGKLQRCLLRRAQPIDPRRDDRGYARGDLDPVGLPDEAVGAAGAGQHARIDEVAHALLEEQRIAFARREQTVPQLREIGRTAEQSRKQLIGACRLERVDAQLRVMCPAAPPVAILRAVVDEQEDATGGHALHQADEQRLGLAVDLVQVLEDQGERLPLAFAHEQRLEPIQSPPAPLGRIERLPRGVLDR
jgi:hypothetical protein